MNEDDDECLRLRLAGSLQAEQPCQLCGVRTRLYPLGLNFAPACEKCCHDHNVNATTLYSNERWGIPATSHWHSIAESIRGSFSVPASWLDRGRDLSPCVACGHGDNSSQHWARFCIIPVLVANTLSPSTNPVRSLDQLARVSTAGCVVASHVLHQFRRLLLEHGGMQHSTSSVSSQCARMVNPLARQFHTSHSNPFPPGASVARTSPACCRGQSKPSMPHANHHQRSSYSPLGSTPLTSFAPLLPTIAPNQPIAVLPLGHPMAKPHHPNQSAVCRISPQC